MLNVKKKKPNSKRIRTTAQILPTGHEIKGIWKMTEIPIQLFKKLLFLCTQHATYALINLTKM